MNGTERIGRLLTEHQHGIAIGSMGVAGALVTLAVALAISGVLDSSQGPAGARAPGPSTTSSSDADNRDPSSSTPATIEPSTPPSSTPVAIPVSGEIVPGALVQVVATEPLVLRSAAGTGAGSEILESRLHPGMRMRVLEGPVVADGYAWFRIRVGLMEGWAASAAKTGEAWMAPVTNGQIAYLRATTMIGTEEVFLINPDGTGEVQVTCFLELCDTSSAARPDVIADIQRGDVSVVPALSCGSTWTQTAWAPTGIELLVDFGTGVCAGGIYLIEVGVELRDHVAPGWEPSWHPGGRLFAVSVDPPWQPCGPPTCPAPDIPGGLHVVDADSGVLEVRGDDSSLVQQVSWSPDGASVAFVRGQLGQPDPEIWLMASDGSDPRHLTDGSAPSWSPDGTRIAFHRQTYVDGQDGTRLLVENTVFVRDLSSGTERKIASGTIPRWSPDGQLIAYASGTPQEPVSEAQFEYQAAVTAPDGSDNRTLSDLAAGSPRWSPDGTRLVLWTGSAYQPSSVFVVDADGGEAAELAPGYGADWQPIVSVSR